MTLSPLLHAGLIGWLLLSGCSTPERDEDIPSDPLPSILAETDPVVQSARLDALITENAGQLTGLCERIPEDTAARRQCERARSRPHLYWPERPTSQGPSTISPHLRMRTFPVPDPGVPPWQDATGADITPCRDANEPTRCLERLVTQLTDDIPAASATCLAWDVERGKDFDECIFRLSEAVAASRTPAAITAALALCPHVQRFGEMCILHTILIAARPSGSVSEPSQEGKDAVARAEALSDSPLGEHYTDLYWSVYTAALIDNPALAHQVFPSLPPQSAAHQRMAIATRSVGSLEPEAFTTGLLAQASALTARSVLRPRPGGPRTSSPPRPTTRWRDDLPGEAAIASTTRFGEGLRAADEDPEVDARIALLEAAAMRAPPPPPGFFFALIGSEEPEVVRWTAARIGRQLYPTHHAPEDESPLVTQRLAIQ